MGLWRNKNTVDPGRGSSRRSAESRGVPSPGVASEFDYRVNRHTWFSRLLLQPRTASGKVSIHIIRRLNLVPLTRLNGYALTWFECIWSLIKQCKTGCRSYTNSHKAIYVIVNINDMFLSILEEQKRWCNPVSHTVPQNLLLPVLEGWSTLVSFPHGN